ncbi:TIM barrel protein [Eubacteriales bacterium OttesenSCG-928-G02]|nr:TIM barrel protein [Eubacteriales bacterium OttesenSCG-928-G02]
MKSKFGPGGNSLSFYEDGKKSTAAAPEWLAKKGLDAYEYQAGKGIFAHDETLIKIGEKAKEYNIAMSLHAPYYISLSSADPEKRENSIGYIIKSGKATDLLNGNLFVVHSGGAAKLDRETAMQYAEETLYKAAEAMSEEGINAKAGIEVMGKLNQLGTLDEVVRLCKISPKHFCPVVDFGHLYCRTNAGLKTTDDFKNVFHKISELGAEFANNLHCHFSKMEFTSMGEKRHVTFADKGYGPDFEPLAEAIADLGISPTIICESHGTMAEDALEMKNILSSVLESRAL